MTDMLVLASQSPRRREILQRAGIPFEVRISGVPEDVLPDESPEQFVRRVSRAKAEAVRQTDSEIVLGADTTVVVDEHILNKPEDAADARRMLRLLSGREHIVLTGIALAHRGGVIQDCSSTVVSVVSLSEQEIDAYVESGEPMDKAGAYAIQGLASKFIDRIDGDYLNIVGLPVALVYSHLKMLGCLA